MYMPTSATDISMALCLPFLVCLLQIVQNGITWGSLQWEKFDKPGNPEVPNNGSPSIQWMEMKGLWAIMAVECVLLIAFLALAIGLMWVPYIGACKQHRVRQEAVGDVLWHTAEGAGVLVVGGWVGACGAEVLAKGKRGECRDMLSGLTTGSTT
jgi:hypothetical protein